MTCAVCAAGMLAMWVGHWRPWVPLAGLWAPSPSPTLVVGFEIQVAVDVNDEPSPPGPGPGPAGTLDKLVQAAAALSTISNGSHAAAGAGHAESWGIQGLVKVRSGDSDRGRQPTSGLAQCNDMQWGKNGPFFHHSTCEAADDSHPLWQQQ